MDILKNNLHYWISFITYFEGGREFTSEKDPNPSKKRVWAIRSMVFRLLFSRSVVHFALTP